MSWIKVEYALLSKPEVMAMAARFDVSEFEIVGHLVAFWCWVDANMSLECPEVIGTKRGLDRVCGREGMVEALIEVGWLIMNGQKFSVPNLDRHLSKGAKQRTLEARKKKEQRERPENVPQMSPECPEPNGTNVPQMSPECPEPNGTKNGHVLSYLISSVSSDVPERSSGTKIVANKNDYLAEFESFWNAYPRKNDKLKAVRKGKVAIKTKDPKTLVKAALRYAELKREDPEFIKHAATWLNDGSWENEYLSATKTPSVATLMLELNKRADANEITQEEYELEAIKITNGFR